AYMSPEQAEGREIDARSDIFSFGSVLYEMVTGQRAFRGESQAAILATVLRSEPRPVSEIAPDTPRELERIVQRCLRKNADRRFHNRSDVRVELEEIEPDSTSAANAAPARPAARWPWAAAVLAAVAAAAGGWHLRSKTESVQQLVAAPLTSDPGY